MRGTWMAWVLAMLIAMAPAALRLVHPTQRADTAHVQATIGPAPTDSPHSLVRGQ